MNDTITLIINKDGDSPLSLSDIEGIKYSFPVKYHDGRVETEAQDGITVNASIR